MSGTSKIATAAAWIRNGVSNKGPEELTKASLNSSYIPALTAYEYRGHIITAWARPEFTNGSTSVGIVYKRARLGSILQVQRIEGQLFETKEQAEQHGVNCASNGLTSRSELGATMKEPFNTFKSLKAFEVSENPPDHHPGTPAVALRVQP